MKSVGILKYSLMVENLIVLIINEKKKPGVLQTYRCPLCDKYFMREYFWNQYVDYCEAVW